jgi:uncharacterized membrane protein YfhO
LRWDVILEGAPAWTPPAGAPESYQPVTSVEYVPNGVVVRAASETPAVLVLTDTYRRGWTVTVDGEPAELYIANHAFRGVILPTGAHEIVFTYWPLSLPFGAGISGIALMAIVGVAVYSARRRTEPA